MKKIMLYTKIPSVNSPFHRVGTLQSLKNNSMLILLCTALFCGSMLGSTFTAAASGTNRIINITELTQRLSPGGVLVFGVLIAVIIGTVGLFCAVSGFGIPVLVAFTMLTGGFYGGLLVLFLQTWNVKGLGCFCLILLPGAMIRAVSQLKLFEMCAKSSKQAFFSVCFNTGEDFQLKEKLIFLLVHTGLPALAALVDFLLFKLFGGLF